MKAWAEEAQGVLQELRPAVAAEWQDALPALVRREVGNKLSTGRKHPSP